MFGLILTGGRSSRMGQDKSLLNYHGKPQREYLFDLLSPICEQVFMSCNANQIAGLQALFPYIEDTFEAIGPLGGIATAFEKRPHQTWLVVACDMPFLTEKTIHFLVENQDDSMLATAFRNPENGFPEPLVAIYEPSFYAIILEAISQGKYSPSKLLSTHEVCFLDILEANEFHNINSLEDYQQAKKLI